MKVTITKPDRPQSKAIENLETGEAFVDGDNDVCIRVRGGVVCFDQYSNEVVFIALERLDQYSNCFNHITQVEIDVEVKVK